MNKTKRVALWCDCIDPSHQALVELDYYHPYDDPIFTLRLTLNTQVSFWHRLVIAFRYLFKRKSYNHSWDGFNDVQLDEVEIDKLSKMIIQYRLLYKLKRTRREKQRYKEI